MDLGENMDKPVLEPFTPLIVFVTGLAFCVLIWLLTIYFMATSEIDYLHHVVTHRYTTFNYIGLTGFIFIGFSTLGLLFLPYRKKAYTIALIVSCLAIGFNTAILQTIARVGHAGFVRSLERAILSPDTPSHRLPSIKNRYAIAVDLWREIENPTFQPIESAYWSEAEKANFNTNSFTRWGAVGAISNNVPTTLLFSPQGKAIGILTDGTRLFGFAGNDADRIHDQEDITFSVGTDRLRYEFIAVRTNGVLDTCLNMRTDLGWDVGKCKYKVMSEGSRP